MKGLRNMPSCHSQEFRVIEEVKNPSGPLEWGVQTSRPSHPPGSVSALPTHFSIKG